MAIVTAGTRVLVTGAAGFIGSHLVRLLVNEGQQVTAVVRPGDPCWRLADVRSRLNVVECDLVSSEDIVQKLGPIRPDICIHLAWKGWSGKPAADANLSSLGVSLELLRKMPALECERFVAAGTCFEYELSGARLTEQSPLKPHDLYGACKKSLFEVAQEFSALTGISVVTPRIFYSYGPSEDPRRLVPSIALALMNGETANATLGEQVRDYLHVQDVVSAIWAVSRSDVSGAVNIASGVPVTIAELANTISGFLGRPDLLRLGALKYRDGEPMHIVGDPSILRDRLGWAPRFTLAGGLAETIAWWQDSGNASTARRHAS